MDFAGSPEVRGSNRMENAMKDLRGTMWIDPEAKQVVAMHIEVTENIHIGGGLVANFEKGTTFDFDQKRIHDQIWQPSRNVSHIVARMMLVKGVRQDRTVEYSNYKEFKTEVKIIENAEPVEP